MTDVIQKGDFCHVVKGLRHPLCHSSRTVIHSGACALGLARKRRICGRTRCAHTITRFPGLDMAFTIPYIFALHSAWIYIMTNNSNSTLYIGVTTNIYVRVKEHQLSSNPRAFTAKYKLHKLVYYEGFASVIEAIGREKFLKGKSRKYKVALINGANPKWTDLSNKTAAL
jgi:putative endonuclease